MRGNRLLFLGVAALCFAPAVMGAEVNRSWDALVSGLKPGRTVVVPRHGGNVRRARW